MHATLPLLKTTDFPPLTRRALDTLQVNLGYRCNQACHHCHVNASPDRKEMMSRETIDDVLRVLAAGGIGTLDVTGGAPELNPHFRHLVREARALGVRVIDRCNLTILNEPGFEDLAAVPGGRARSKSPRRCPATRRTTSTGSAATTYSIRRSSRSRSSTRWATASTAPVSC